METVSLSIRYDQKDYVRALRAHYASRLRLPLDIAVIVFVSAIGLYEWSQGSHGFGIFLLSVAGIFALMLVAAFTVVPIIAFRNQLKFRDEYTLDFSQQGIHFRTAHIDSDLKWTMYTNALIDKYSFVLYYGSRQFTVIPKRAFKDVSHQQVFEKLLVANVPKIVNTAK